MIRTLSQIESARRDTIITRASDAALDKLAKYYYLSRPSAYPLAAWREVLAHVVYQPRGTYRVLFHALNALFSPWRDSVQLTVDIDAAGGFTHADLTSTAYAHRWVRINGKYYWIDSVDTGTTTAQLAKHRSEYWDSWAEAAAGVSVSWLPFYIIELPAKIEIYLDVELLAVPPTYAQPAGAARPATQPHGGHLLNLLDLDPATLDYGDQARGPFPLYLAGDEVGGILGDLLRQIIPSGVEVTLAGTRWGDALGFPSLSSQMRQGSV